ncbi:MAG: DUF4331 domain-containing protein, partial [Vicinamibacterales bacterium]
INVGEVLDLINTNPLGPENGEINDLAGKNVTTLALEVPISCLVASDAIIGAWTTSSMGKGKPAADGSTGNGSSAVVTSCPAGRPSSPRPSPSFVPTQDCNGWVPSNHPQALGNSSNNGNGNGNSSDSAACPAGQPASARPSPSFVPTQDCQGWVPSNHPQARSAAAGTPPGQFTQVSRLGMPLVNEVVIGLKDKDKFNASEPSGDVQFLDYVTHPSLPVLIQLLFKVPPPEVPRADLVAVFLTGVMGLNQPANVSPSEMLRLNTGIAPRVEEDQNRLGVIAGDTAGFPNGRRPGDDIVDIELRVVEGILLGANSINTRLTDGAFASATVSYDPLGNMTGPLATRLYRNSFPYLTTPLSASPNPTHQ